ncbi:response regulator [Magnetospirillum sp. UT-4]|uniref:response regulator n=1 Tax=Magnetospirillum sp. UT-4 TaxID=2681467 RepID=UPI00137E401E|nr:response regulator [Magnetospirillum sp. UT-4]CAA7615254.1 Response regulator rcp1 [Magnetospirillum sp. UT-4]
MNRDTARKYVLLLVEDDPADAHLVRLAFAGNDFNVDFHMVRDGVEAFEFLRRVGDRFQSAPRPDVILLDLNMPRMDGREFLAAIKKDEGLRSIPVVVLTTSDVERDTVASYRMGAAGYLVKPVDIDRFRNEIRQFEDYWFSVVRLPERR